jgi:peptide chain release factor 1
LTVDGPEQLVKPLLSETGGHRWQRVPPTERNGRVHTSTVTVVALLIPDKSEWSLNDRDIEVFTKRSSGAGGQHVNKTESCVVMRHVPTGIEAKSALKCQHQNRREARAMLEARVKALQLKKAFEELSDKRREKGSGMRGDKIRTYREKDDIVIDHRTDKKYRLKDIRVGKLKYLHE